MKRHLAVVALLTAGMLAGCQSKGSDDASWWTVGMCMHIEGATGNISGIGNVSCPEPHTHVVLARVAWSAPCPVGSDTEFRAPDDSKFCFRKDAALRSDAS